MLPSSTSALYNHLGNSLSTKRLAALELLTLETSKRIEDGCEQKEDGRYIIFYTFEDEGEED